MRIESISLDLCIGNKASLVWVGQDHFFHRLKFLELIVDQTPIPACFNDGFAWPFQTGKKLRKPSCAIAFDSSLAQLPPALIQRAQHAVLLVDIYSDVVHENSFLSSSSLRTEMLLSCYLTPILPLVNVFPGARLARYFAKIPAWHCLCLCACDCNSGFLRFQHGGREPLSPWDFFEN